MNARSVLIAVCVVVCLVTVTGVVMRGSQLGNLRAEQRRLLAQLETVYNASGPAPAETAARSAQHADYSPSRELLRLRDQVTRLTARKRELAGVANENERLRAQLAARATNAVQLPPDYLRRSEARMVGYSTPEATIQTFLWAIQNRDFQNLLRTLTPEAARRLQTSIQQGGRPVEQSVVDFFRESMLPGLHIREQQQQEDGSILLKVEVVPGAPGKDTIRLRQSAGQWKIDEF